ncbi:MAG: chorismate synthase, partial [Elusimicrobia bacterium]|nr:chorismate synthase [Elusimicrobiota bacterium]
MRYMTAGESHGRCLTAIMEGIPAGLKIKEDHINHELARRQYSFGRGERLQYIEKDRA